MKLIDIRDQPKLGLTRTASLTAHGVRYRLFRSLVTVVVIAVAVAFLMNILSESVLKRSVAQMVRTQATARRQAAAWAARLTTRGSLLETLREIAAVSPGDPVYREAQTFGRLTDAEMAAYHATARQAAAYLSFFGELDYARRRRLVRDATGTAIFDRLQDAAARETFQAALKTMRALRWVTSVDEFNTFLQHWPALASQTERIVQGRNAAVARLGGTLAGRPIIVALTDAAGSVGDAIRAAGFAFSPATGQEVARQAQQILDTQQVEASFRDREVQGLVAARLDKLPSEVNLDVLWGLLAERAQATWYLGKLQTRGAELGMLTVERVQELARAKATDSALTQAEHESAMDSGGVLGLGERMAWLVFVSMLVCVVGIANAMLMSVTERFREIATLKCLGALDGSIMLLFVIEACLLGVAGGISGALAGVVIGTARMWVAFGSLLGAAIPWSLLLALMGLAVVLGVVLAAVAAVYPSFKAARLAPMEAMRIE